MRDDLLDFFNEGVEQRHHTVVNHSVKELTNGR